MIGARAAGDTPERRLLRHDPRARRWMTLAVAAAVGASLALVVQLIVVALAVAGVFLDGRTLGDVTPLLALGFGLLVGVLGALRVQGFVGALLDRLRGR